ncbi:hypothetical protein CLOM_g10052 [Closterium sp. NIES-68]|nr:hypothetical protein CLOM_g10052 [Closterium sp. NIES-68]GJP58767.1 hypothetical protein CLOP_g3377 [Closterium sp. NIES-67]
MIPKLKERQAMRMKASSRLRSPPKPSSANNYCHRPSFTVPRCHFCHGKADGVYADAAADPPCSAYLVCRRQQLASMDACPDGTYFNLESASCGALESSSCAVSAASAAAASGGAAGFVAVARGAGKPVVGTEEVEVESVGDRRKLQGWGTRAAVTKPPPKAPSPNPTNWTEVNALLALKNSNVDAYYKLKTWIVPAIPALRRNNFICGKWWGVKCNKFGSVIELNLAESGLAGIPSVALNSIPPEIGNLSSLMVLDITGTQNRLTSLIGVLPNEISRLTKLQTLLLFNNRLVGSIPETISALTDLVTLDLTQNNFTGSIPKGFGNLKKLGSLSLGLNGLSGPIPASLGQASSLSTVSLRGNALTGGIPDSLANLKQLGFLELQSNQLSGPLPVWLKDLAGYIDLGSNNFSGIIPPEWKDFKGFFLSLNTAGNLGQLPASIAQAMCTTATSIDFSNIFTGGDLNQWDLSGCTALSMLYLEGDDLTGDVGKFLGAVPATSYMQVIILSKNRLTGEIPPQIFQIPTLTQFDANENQLTGSLPLLQCTGTLANMVPSALNVSTNRMSGVLPERFAEACNMSQVDLSHNQFSGPVPAGIAQSQTLAVLDLTNNSFTGDVPVPTSCLGSGDVILHSLRVGLNQFTGKLPNLLGNCTALEELDLSGLDITGDLNEGFTNMGEGYSVIQVNLSSTSLSGALPEALNNFVYISSLDLSNSRFQGPVPSTVGDLVNLRALDLSGNQLQGQLPAEIGNLTAATFIALEGNQLSGTIPPEIAPQPSSRHLAFLSSLDLSDNDFTGPIPYGFANVSSSFYLDVSQNQLSGAIPGGSSGYFASANPATISGNQALCGMNGYPDCPSPNNLSAGAIAGIVVGAVVGLVAIAVTAWWFSRRNDPWSGGTMLVFEKLDFKLTVGHILEATEFFSDKYKLGRGGFGTVYRASLQDGRSVAIKRLAAQSTQGNREFQAEMETLGNIRHRNLVVLVAAYIAPGQSTERLLIYDFLSGGSVDTIFMKELPKDSPFCKWSVRRNVALDTARGMKYLHHDCTPRIIHRDMKPGNVLLDDQMVAHVADFGLAREIDVKQSHMSTKVFGTIGYLAPEYTRQGRLSFKSDVFAYGVMLLQLITGKQPTDEDVAERGLARWAEANGAAAIVDPRMELEPGEIDQILGAVKLGLLCTARVASDRPSMPEIVHLLENLEDFAKGVGTTATGKKE